MSIDQTNDNSVNQAPEAASSALKAMAEAPVASASVPPKPAAGKRSAANGRKRSKKVKRNVVEGEVHILATYNNTIITFTDKQGNKLCQTSAGQSGFRGSRKSTPFAAQVAAEAAGTLARDEYGMKAIAVNFSGPGPGRESAARGIFALGFKVVELRDKTPVPHNGVRRPKRRRV